MNEDFFISLNVVNVILAFSFFLTCFIMFKYWNCLFSFINEWIAKLKRYKGKIAQEIPRTGKNKRSKIISVSSFQNIGKT